LTCIVGIEYNGNIYMGGDSAGSNGWSISTQVSPKIFKVGELLIGYTSSFRMGQLLQYQLEIEAQEQGSNEEYMIKVFAETARSLFKEYGYSKIEKNEEEGGRFLVGYRGELYLVQSDFSVLRTIDRFNSVGCGAAYALGALKILDLSDPEVALTKALESAAYFSTGVRGPFHFLKSLYLT